MSGRYDNDETHTAHPAWLPERRPCPFCMVPAMQCGCPEGERIEALRMQHYDGMGVE